MSSGTPAWAVLVVAALGVLGTLAAAVITQILSGRREARQWERQRAHEQTRWERERDERREQWEREDHSRWHQERLAAYTELLQRIEDWDMAVLHVLHPVQPGPAALSPDERKSVGEALAAITRADTKARFFASEDTIKAAREYFLQAATCYARLDGGGLDDPERLKPMRLAMRKLDDKKRTLLEQTRRDLGIGAEHPDEE
ncbi:hypothetical protein AB0H57_05445 [Micromonospora sp. NPDC050686]|uniref:hypothetical protein n=1 Tax=Micromonospora sp. NPDC050686 TaxID=3154631 RepID=UPI0033C7FF7C